MYVENIIWEIEKKIKMLNKTIKDFLSNKHSKWTINAFDSFEQYLFKRFAKYYISNGKNDFEKVVEMFSDLDEYSPLDNNEDMEKISFDLGRYTYKYINLLDHYFSITPFSVFVKEYKQGHLIYLIIKIRIKELLLNNKELIKDYIEWNQKSSNVLESDK